VLSQKEPEGHTSHGLYLIVFLTLREIQPLVSVRDDLNLSVSACWSRIYEASVKNVMLSAGSLSQKSYFAQEEEGHLLTLKA
jgi:hypothetical protein